MTRSIVAAVIASMMLSAAPAQAQKGDERGAVLCAWMIYSSVLHTGETCVGDTDVAFVNALRRAVDDIENFTIRNSKTTKEELAIERAKRNARSRPDMCEPGSGSMVLYEHLRERATPEKLVEEIDKFLAVDREPVWNPCL